MLQPALSSHVSSPPVTAGGCPLLWLWQEGDVALVAAIRAQNMELVDALLEEPALLKVLANLRVLSK